MAKKDNTTMLLGIAALGAAAWYFFGRGTGKTETATAVGPRPFGDPNNPASVAYKCNAARHLIDIGHPDIAAQWVTACQAGGGTVPSSSAMNYR
jgi:hypothetical protein